MPVTGIGIGVGIRVIEWKRRKEGKTEIVDKNDTVEMVEATKPIIPTEVAVVETVEAGRGV